METKSVQVNTRVEPTLAVRLDLLANATGRTRPNLVYQAIVAFVDSEIAFFEAVERGRAQAYAGLGCDFAAYAADLQERIRTRLAS